MASMDLAPGLSCSARSLILFIFGCTLAIVLMTFQYEHKLLLLNDPSLLLNLPSLSVICVCGLGAAMVGHLYPKLMASMDLTSILDYNDDTLQKSQICKSLVLFVGINHMCAKIPFQSDLHFTVIITVLCVAFWWVFDGSILAFAFSTFVSLFLTTITVILLRAGGFQYTYSDFYLKTCVSCLTFAGAILTIQISKLLSHNNQSHPTSFSIEHEHVKNE